MVDDSSGYSSQKTQQLVLIVDLDMFLYTVPVHHSAGKHKAKCKEYIWFEDFMMSLLSNQGDSTKWLLNYE